jgi:hypothetical protein
MPMGHCEICKTTRPETGVSPDYHESSHKEFVENEVVKIFVIGPKFRWTYRLSKEFASTYFVEPGSEELSDELPAWADEVKYICAVCFSRRNVLMGLPSTIDPEYEI